MKASSVLFLTLTSVHILSQISAKKLICYYGSWAVYRPEPGKFDVEQIEPKLCTHLIFGFVGLSGNSIKVLDPWNELEDNYGKGAFKRFVGLKKINPSLKTLVAIGGWNEGSTKYSTMASSAAGRKAFTESSVNFLRKYGFDGLDMDWEYPAARGGRPEDKANYILLLKGLHEAFKPHGYLLTAAVSAGKATIDAAYDIPKASQYLDFINVMTYDFHGGWEKVTGHNSPLYARPDEDADQQTLNTNWSINYWISQGAPKEKIVLGIGLYGRAFTLSNQHQNGIFAPAPQAGQQGPYSREAGMLGYNEICESFQKEKWTIVRDEYYKVPYAYKDRQWVGYDDQKSIQLKVDYIKSMGFGGGMVWSIETDDFHGNCHGEKFPLISIIHRGLIDGTFPPILPTEEPVTDKPATDKPITNLSEDGSNCTEEGWFRDPNNCAKFWRCYKLGKEIMKEDFVCDSGTVFDTTLDSCNWAGTVPGC